MKKGFFHHTLILTMAGIVVRLLGAIYRILLPRLIGAEGVGLYQMAYPVYSLLLVAAIPGFPLAISKLIAEKRGVDEESIGSIFFGGLLVLFLSGLFFTALLLLLAPSIASHILGDPRSFYPLFFMAPSILFFFLLSGFRGYFQGLENMTPTGLSLIVEQLVRLVTIIIVLYSLRDAPIQHLAGGAALGHVTGSLVALTLLSLLFVRQAGNRTLPFKRVKASLWQGIKIYPLAIPISLGALIMPLMGLVDAVIVPNRLQMAGRTMEEATSLFGQLSGMAMTVFFFPTVISGALALSILPFVSQMKRKGEYRWIVRRTRQAHRLVFMVMFPATVGILLFSSPICHLLFGYASAGIPLFFLVFGLTLYSLQDISASILQGLDLVGVPAKNLLFGAIFNGLLNYSLTPILGIRGAAIGTLTGITIGSLLNLRAVSRELGSTLWSGQDVLKPLIGALGMGVILFYLYPILLHFFIQEWATIISMIIGIVVYFFLILINGGLKVEDLKLLPIIGPQMIDRFNLR